MNILIPMAGEGSRFKDKGYKQNKAAINTTDRRTGQKKPMVVCAVSDLPDLDAEDTKIVFVDRDFHKYDGVEELILRSFDNVEFITLTNLTEGQACTCLKAKTIINNDDPLLISACDNGIEYDYDKFDSLRQIADVIVFTFTHNESVKYNPNAYGWVKVDDEMNVEYVSVKKSISDKPEEDHAIIATFWYKKGSDFVYAAEQMIKNNDRVNNEFYVDSVINYNIKNGCVVKAFDVTKYLCWGTPIDYENYENTIKYWNEFISRMESELPVNILTQK